MTPQPKLANPAVVGLAGFGLTTLVLQFHNVGWAGNGPVVWLGLIFGGLAQMIAGFQEQKTGNTFGYTAFVSYGAFWISLCLMLLGNNFGIFKASTTDVGWFLVAWTLYTAILLVGAIRIHAAMATTFTSLLIGFILLDLGHFGYPICNKLAGFELMFCAASAWYMMAGIVLADVYGRPILPFGRPWVSAPTTTPAAASNLAQAA
jgi:succinate-acetate transporter protein